jgi:ribosomal protein S18 acetylase RimI-like enzyme
MTATSRMPPGERTHDVGICLATDDDVPAMAELLGVLFRIESDFAPDAEKQREGLRLLLRSSSARAWVARRGGRVVGMVTLQTVVSTAEGAAAGILEDLVVAPEFRRCGIGGALLEAAMDYARASGIGRIQLLADADNEPALDFYRALDWKPTNLVALRRRIGQKI